MQESLEDIAYTVGGAIIAPGPGSAELLLTLLIGLGFAASAVHALWTGWHGHGPRWPGGHRFG